jgi:hypothetical protein
MFQDNNSKDKEFILLLKINTYYMYKRALLSVVVENYGISVSQMTMNMFHLS